MGLNCVTESFVLCYLKGSKQVLTFLSSSNDAVSEKYMVSSGSIQVTWNNSRFLSKSEPPKMLKIENFVEFHPVSSFFGFFNNNVQLKSSWQVLRWTPQQKNFRIRAKKLPYTDPVSC